MSDLASHSPDDPLTRWYDASTCEVRERCLALLRRCIRAEAAYRRTRKTWSYFADQTRG